MVLTFDTFNLKRLIRVCDKISTPFCLLLILCYLQRMRLYPVVFDIYHNKWVILNLFLITMFFSYKCTRQTCVLVRGLYHCGFCTSPTFVSPMFVLPNLCSVRRLWVQRLYMVLNLKTKLRTLLSSTIKILSKLVKGFMSYD